MLTSSGPSLRVDYDYQQDDGAILWAAVTFEEVLAFEYRNEPCCREEDIVELREIRSLADSAYLTATVTLWQEAVGWQEFQRRLGGKERFRHFTMWFDHAGCVNVVASVVEVHPPMSRIGQVDPSVESAPPAN